MKKLVVFIVTVLILQMFFLIGYADGEEIEYNVERQFTDNATVCKEGQCRRAENVG